MRRMRIFVAAGVLAASASLPGILALDAGPKPPKNPAKVDVTVTPQPVQSGGQVQVRVQLNPAPGIKINRYPKIRVTVPAQEGLVAGAEAAVGNDRPPPPDNLEANYYMIVEPVELALQLDPAAPPGKHEIQSNVKYFYCVTASGFCAPHQTEVKIPVSVKSN